MKMVIFPHFTRFIFANMTVQKLNFIDLPVFILQKNRDSSQKVNTDLATEDAKKLYEVRNLIQQQFPFCEHSIFQEFENCMCKKANPILVWLLSRDICETRTATDG